MGIVIAAAVAALAGYAVLCALQPFAPCRKCEGMGRTRSGRRSSKPCRHCRGTGARLRHGRRAHNAWTRTREVGSK